MKKKQIAVLSIAVYAAAVALSIGISAYDNGFEMSESELSMMCVSSVYPSVTRGVRDIDRNEDKIIDKNGTLITTDGIQIGRTDENLTSDDGNAEVPSQIIDTQDPQNPSPATPNVDTSNGKPLVIIYHTHATEAYQPVSSGNFRTTDEAGSVREVGNVLASELESLGISVVHDKTLHDAESYNQSYTRSLETVKNLMTSYPSAIFIVDLHRDAAAYTGNVGKTVSINGETAAAYALVVGEGNPNAANLTAYANAINAKAEELYPGFGGRIISKAYKYNQYVSDYHILLEVGNNENNIRESKITAKYFAHVLAAVIDDLT